ncbi:MAG: hypothetical protein PHR00_03500 [Patescibacteria group bacterium]|nr:hypothetical protein [Patescibacteria group bacterium]
MLPSITLPEMLYSINDNDSTNILKILGVAFILIIVIGSFVFSGNFNKKITKFKLPIFWVIAFILWLPLGLGEMIAYAKNSLVDSNNIINNSTDERQLKRFCATLENQGGTNGCSLHTLIPYLKDIPIREKVYYDSPIEIFANQIRHRLNGNYELVDNPNDANYLILFATYVEYGMTPKGEVFRDGQKLNGKYEILKEWDGQTALLKRK